MDANDTFLDAAILAAFPQALAFALSTLASTQHSQAPDVAAKLAVRAGRALEAERRKPQGADGIGSARRAMLDHNGLSV